MTSHPLSFLRCIRIAVAASVLFSLAVAAPAKSAFPGDNGLIAYQDQPSPGNPYQIFTVGADGTGPTKITSGGMSFSPAFSPDGRQLAVFRLAGNDSGVWIVDLDGTWVRKLAAFPSNLSDSTTPAWSPDGQQIVYTLDDKLWIVNANGSGEETVFNDPKGNPVSYDPAWSPDGSLIAFSGYDELSEQLHVYTVTPTGSGLTQLTDGETANPNWSPDGSLIAFTRFGPANSDLWVMDADGSNEVRLTSTAGATGREGWPSWSPNGKRIAFYDQQEGALSTIKPDGTGRQVVRGMPQGAGAPDWQPELRAPSTVSLNYSTGGNLVRANGQVDPPHPGHDVEVDLAVQRNKWVTVATKSPTLSANSRYVVNFARRSDSLCRLTATFPGDTDHRQSLTIKIFSC